MGFDNHYPNRKDWRKPYRKAARFDRSCRPHGGCGYCEDNRLYTNKKRLLIANESLKDFLRNDDNIIKEAE